MNIIPALWCRELLFILCLIISSDDGMISTTIPYFPTTTSFTSIANQIAKEQNNDSTIYSKENTPSHPMENTTSFPIEKDDNKSHSIVDVPSVKKEDNNFAIKLWADSVNKLRNMASPRALEKPKCPNGYKELVGTFRGATLGDLEKNVTVDQCAEMCNEEKLCNAFEYDGGSKSCKINHDPNPNRKKFFNWFFCQKEKISCSPG